MCGICGAINIRIEKSTLDAMVDSLRHRGPDDSGIYTDESGIALGQTRLSIIDLSSGGHQPMVSSDGRHVMVFNGEIYNFLELQDQLKKVGYEFRSGSDTEVLINAFDHWGVECLGRLKGMFAFAIYDKVGRSLFIARDRFGEKPLYYSRTTSGGFLFASELRSLLVSGAIERELNTDVIGEFLSTQTVHPPATLVKDISALESGHYILVSENSFEKKCYWKPTVGRNDDDLTTAFSRVRELFMASVGRQLISDVPLGAFLSGGIDSTILVGVASLLSSKKFSTYTVAFDDSEFKDGYYSQKAADFFKTDHHEIKLKIDDVLHQVPAALNAFDHPSADGINTYLVSGAVAKSGLKVALSGIGGDEIFAGYDNFKLLSSLQEKSRWIGLFPKSARRGLTSLFERDQISIHTKKKLAYLKSNLSLSAAYEITRKFYFDLQIEKFGLKNRRNIIQSIEFQHGNSFSAISELELQYYMHDVLLRDTDQMSMNHALEVRAPFLDYELVDYVMSLPDDFKKDKSVNKPLFVNALMEFIPEELISRQKQGFSMPFDRWIRNELHSFCSDRLRNLKSMGLLEPDYIDSVWKQFKIKPQTINWSRIWLLVSLSNWISKNGIRVSHAG